MKNILLLFAFISFANLQAQEINLRNMTKEERIRYVSQEATRALDRHLYDFLEELYGPHRPDPRYYALSMSYIEHRISNQAIANFDSLYGNIITDYTVSENDNTYSISFVSNPRLWKPLLYEVTILTNGKVLSIKDIRSKYIKIIYNQ